MSDWQQIIKDQSIATLEKLAEKFGHDVIDVEALKPAFDNFQMRITPAALDQIKEVGDPMWQQYVPTVEELDVVDGVIDSLDEDGDSPVPNITHRYPDRALFLVSPVCASYCRFCTRRRKVGDPEKIPLNQFDSAFQYLREHTEIRDVIMSGGDPMMLSDRRLEYFFQQLRAIPHIEIIRHRQPHHLAPARADHAGILRDGAEVPPDLHEHALQSPERAHAGRCRGARSSVARRRFARLPDGAAQGRQRRPEGDDEADARIAEGARPSLLPIYGRPGGGRRALPHDGPEGTRDHASAPGLDIRPCCSPICHRFPGRRRQGAAAPRVPRVDKRRRSDLPQLRGQAIQVYKQPRAVPAAPAEVERAAEVGVVPISRKKSATPRRTKRRRAAGE